MRRDREKPRFVTPPSHLNMQKIQDYPGHQRFQIKGRSGVVAFMGQLYSDAGRKLPHDPDYLAKHNYTMTPEMANIILQKVTKEMKTCCNASCNYNKLSVNAKFCSECGTVQTLNLEVAKDDKLIQMLKNLDPENPFAVANALEQREVSRAKPADFFTKEDVQQIVAAEVTAKLGMQAAVTGEAAVAVAPKFGAKPFGTVEYSTT